MNLGGIAESLGSYAPAAALITGIFLVIRQMLANQAPIREVRLKGETALWKRIESLEDKIEEKDRSHAEDREEWEREAREERADCAARIAALEKKLKDESEECERRIKAVEGRLRQLAQRDRSFAHLAGDIPPLAVELNTAFPPDLDEEPDADLLRKLKRVPRPKK